MLNYSHKAITVHKGGGGGGTPIPFDTCVGSGYFFLSFKSLNYIILFIYLFIFFIFFFLFYFFFFFWGGGGVRNIDIFGGMKILWIFLGGLDKIGLVLGVSSMYFRVFS